MSKKKRQLITTADELTWKFNQPVIFLGEWCKTFKNKELVKSNINYTLDYHWEDLEKFDRDYKYLDKLYENEIDARNFFWPLSSLPMFQSKSENINSYDLPGRCINLPSFHDISEVEIQKVCSVILNYIETL